jgi:hypothetical protein
MVSWIELAGKQAGVMGAAGRALGRPLDGDDAHGRVGTNRSSVYPRNGASWQRDHLRLDTIRRA